MKKYRKYLLLIVMLFVPVFVNADSLTEVTAFNYGGTNDDVFNDIDFFEDGSYVAVGATKSSFRQITNDSQDNYGIIAVFDADDNIVLEKVFNETFYNESSGSQSKKNELMEVEVIDANSFITCGLNNAEIPYCIKYTKAGDIVWRRNLTGFDGASAGLGLVSTNTKKDWSVLKTSDNGFLVSFANVDTNVDNGKIVKLNANGEIVFTTSSTPAVSAMIETNDKYILTSSNKMRLFEISKSDGSISNTKVYVEDSEIAAIYDIDMVGDGYILSVNNGNSNDVFAQEVYAGVLAKVGTDYSVAKFAKMDVVQNMETVVLSNGNIVSLVDRGTTPTSGQIYIYDSNLNLLATRKYEPGQYFSIRDAKVNLSNGNIYFVGTTEGAIGSNANLGGKDAYVISLKHVVGGSSEGSTGSSSSTGSGSKTTNTVKNPKTGNYISVTFLLVLMIASLSAFIYASKKNKLKKDES